MGALASVLDTTPLNRKKPVRKYFQNYEAYDPLFGNHGLTEKPSTTAGKITLPVLPPMHPSKILQVPYKNHPIFSDPQYWKAFHKRKEHCDDFYGWKQSVRVKDNKGQVLYTGGETRGRPAAIDKSCYMAKS